MELDDDICYRAVLARDPRFDGRFFTAVRTTGIYCRPVCPAVTPRRRNVTFYACAAAAEQAGFRPCKRCRPEASPGTPAWLGTSATVSRMLRCIAEGALDDGSVADLAARLGLGPRQSTRLCERHLGTTPVRLAQTRRVHFARALIEQSALPLSQVALAAGFGSLRRFNALMKATYGCAPAYLRRRKWAEGADVRGGSGGDRDDLRRRKSVGATANVAAAPTTTLATLTCRLAYRPPYDWPQLARFLRGRAIPGVEHATDDSYTRTLALPEGGAGFLTVTPGSGHWLDLRLDLPELGGAIALVARVRRMFDCGADPGGHQRAPVARCGTEAARAQAAGPAAAVGVRSVRAGGPGHRRAAGVGGRGDHGDRARGRAAARRSPSRAPGSRTCSRRRPRWRAPTWAASA